MINPNGVGNDGAGGERENPGGGQGSIWGAIWRSSSSPYRKCGTRDIERAVLHMWVGVMAFSV